MPSRILSEGELAYFPTEQCRKIIHHPPIRQHLVEIKMITPQGRIIDVKNYASMKKSGPTSFALTGSFDATRSSSRKKSPVRALSASTARVGKTKEYATFEESASSSENEKKRTRNPRRQQSSLPTKRNNILLQRVITPKILKRSDYVWITFKYHKPTVSVEYDRVWFEPRGDEIMITQQHCGGENLIVHKDTVQYGGYFSIASRRHPTYPLALVFHINGTVTNRLSICCEWRCQNRCRIGGPNGLFSIEKVENSTPCRRCRGEKYRIMFLEQMEARKQARLNHNHDDRSSPTEKKLIVDQILGDKTREETVPAPLTHSRSSSTSSNGVTILPTKSLPTHGKSTDKDDDSDSSSKKPSPKAHSEEVKLLRPERPSLSAARPDPNRSDSLSSEKHDSSKKNPSPPGKKEDTYDEDFDSDSTSSSRVPNAKAEEKQTTEPTITGHFAPASIAQRDTRSNVSAASSGSEPVTSRNRNSSSKTDDNENPNEKKKDSEREETITMSSLIRSNPLSTTRGSTRTSEVTAKGLEDSSIADTGSTIVGNPEKQTESRRSSVPDDDARKQSIPAQNFEGEKPPENRMEEELFGDSSGQHDDSTISTNAIPQRSTSFILESSTNTDQQKTSQTRQSPDLDFFTLDTPEKLNQRTSPILRKTPPPIEDGKEYSRTGKTSKNSNSLRESVSSLDSERSSSSGNTSQLSRSDDGSVLQRPKSSKAKRQEKNKSNNHGTSSSENSSGSSDDESQGKNIEPPKQVKNSDTSSIDSSEESYPIRNGKKNETKSITSPSESDDDNRDSSVRKQATSRNSPPRIPSDDTTSDSDVPRNTNSFP